MAQTDVQELTVKLEGATRDLVTASEQLKVKAARLEACEAELDKQSRDSSSQLSLLQTKLDRMKASQSEQQHVVVTQVQCLGWMQGCSTRPSMLHH